MRARKAIGDSGEEQRLIRTIARKGFRFVGDGAGESACRRVPTVPRQRTRAIAPALALPDKPSIAVLPFAEPERRSRAGVFRRRHGGGHHHGAVAHALAVRDRAQLELHLQGPRGRREAGRPRAGRALRAGRQRAQGRQPRAHHRPAHRCHDGRAPLGGPVRRRARRHLRAAGPDDRERRRRDRAEAGAGRDRARQAQADREPRRLRLLLRGMASFYHWTREAVDEALRMFSGDRARSRFRLGLWHGRAVLLLAQGERLDGRPRAGDRRNREAGSAGGGVGQG